jgi:serine/threonine protein kinase
LVDELLCTKICDFGLAKRKTLAELPNEGKGLSIMAQNSRVMNVKSAAVQFTTLVGTPAWTAPELIANRSYTEKVDVYSFSVFLWELMCRQTPHEGMPHFELAYEILAHNLRPVIFDFIPETFKQLMQSCWASKSEYRPQIDVVLKILTAMLSQPRHDDVQLPY